MPGITDRYRFSRGLPWLAYLVRAWPARLRRPPGMVRRIAGR